ncbi:hypothetical protein HMPREF1548_06006 [Clostridium sp. KLE 1755]|nr:hypothetical protein HMPREF1548_06006 [Clostridium sp. KLE 1755]
MSREEKRGAYGKRESRHGIKEEYQAAFCGRIKGMRTERFKSLYPRQKPDNGCCLFFVN